MSWPHFALLPGRRQALQELIELGILISGCDIVDATCRDRSYRLLCSSKYLTRLKRSRYITAMGYIRQEDFYV